MAKFLVVLTLSFLLVLVGSIDGIRNETRKFKRNSNPRFSGLLDSFGNQYFRTEYSAPHQSTPSRAGDVDFGDFIDLFHVPHGTKLQLTPSINVPITKSSTLSTDVTSNINVELPIAVTLKRWDLRRVLHKKTDNIYSTVGGFDMPHSYEGQKHGAVESNEIEQQRILSRKLRDLDSVNNGTRGKQEKSDILEQLLFNEFGRCPTKSFSDRRDILQKLELFVGGLIGYSENPKACLLRWTCELHKHMGIAKHYGLIGEGVILMFSTEEISRDCDTGSPDLKYFKPFIKAEVSGKSGNCRIYEKKCSQSLFAF